MESNNQSFWKFPNPSVWSVSNGFGSKRSEERRNFDIRVGGELHNNNTNNSLPVTPKAPNPTTHNPTSDFNAFNYDWKIGLGLNSGAQNQCYRGNLNVGVKGYKLHNFQSNYSNGKIEGDHHLPNNFHGGKDGKKKKKKEGKRECNDNGNKDENKKNSVVDKRFKTLPPAEALPKNETIGGYIFVCNNDTMEDNLKRQLFGLPPRFRDSVRAITPGLPLFLYNYSSHQLHGIFEAASFGGSNIDSSAWEDKKHHGESRFPAQVRVQTRKIYEPLEEDEFRPILHHYDGPKFRLQLSVPEVLLLLDIFEKGHPDV